MTQRIEQKITLPSVSAITNRNQLKLTEESKWYSDQYKTNVGTIIIILLLSLYLLWDTTRDSDIGNRKPIGKVASTINDIERKLGARVVWKSIERNNTIYNYDSIRTNSISRTTVELNDKTKVSLAEDTMVFINTNPEKLDINFIRGEISVDTMNRKKSEVEKINIVHGKEVIKLGKTNLNLSRPTINSSVKLELKEGDAKLEKDGKETSLKKGEIVVSKGNSTSILPIQQNISKENKPFQKAKNEYFRPKTKKIKKIKNKQPLKLANNNIKQKINNPRNIRSCGILCDTT
ncbi:MAG: FecR domain-containing protein [Leptospiraceae bacterium]|nr:FecR domain-containing protein [Leptospiraceae bacterium]